MDGHLRWFVLAREEKWGSGPLFSRIRMRLRAAGVRSLSLNSTLRRRCLGGRFEIGRQEAPTPKQPRSIERGTSSCSRWPALLRSNQIELCSLSLVHSRTRRRVRAQQSECPHPIYARSLQQAPPPFGPRTFANAAATCIGRSILDEPALLLIRRLSLPSNRCLNPAFFPLHKCRPIQATGGEKRTHHARHAVGLGRHETTIGRLGAQANGATPGRRAGGRGHTRLSGMPAG
jgi:hypothetical protein